MLKHLHIQNYALIDHLDIDFQRGFSVITGETGAGKSILLGAIGLLLGQRAETKSIKAGEKRCVIEAQFDLSQYALRPFFEEHELDFDGTECIIRRELTASGKSRAFINDTPATVGQLKDLGERLIDIHSQHQNLLLSQEDFQLQVLDLLAQNTPLLDDYQAAYRQRRDTKRRLEEARETQRNDQTERDYLQFQYDQLDGARLRDAAEQERLEGELQTLEHAEDIKGSLYQVNDLLQGDGRGLLNRLREAQRQLEGIADVFPPAAELARRVESCHIELKDVASEVEGQAEGVEYDPQRLTRVSERLNLIYDLQQKHRLDTLTQLMALRDDLERRLLAMENSGEHIAALETLLQQQEAALKALADRLSARRAEAAILLEKEMCQRLLPLGMPNIRFEALLQPTKDFEPRGCDQVQFLFCANKSGHLLPIAQVASGGEIARVMLSLKALISGFVQLPTLIFDEIDTGVSGHIAESMAKIMQQMGAGGHRQVISITHLPQIAAVGAQHYRVYKEDTPTGTTSRIARLTQEERVEELAHMLSGASLTQAAVDNARALLLSHQT